MARRSPTQVSQKYETGCSWRMFGIFNSREDNNSNKNRRHLNTHTTGNGNLRIRNSEVLSTISEKYLDITISSRRRTGYYSCKSINSTVESDQVEDGGNEVTKMIVDQRLFNKNSQGKDGASFQPDQFLDALQILYSNKELFVKLLQDPNSLLVKQIHDLESSQVKEPYQARQKRVTRFQNFTARQSVRPFKSFQRCDLSSSCEPHSSNNHSYYTNVQNIKSSNFPFGRIKRKLRHAMRVKRKEQQWWKTAGVPSELHCNSRGLEGGKKGREFEIGGRNSPINVQASIGKKLNSPLDLKKRDKTIMLKDSELCMRQEADTFDIADISIRKSLPGKNLNAHYDTPRDGEYKDTPTQNFDINNTTGGLGSFQDSEIQAVSFSPEAASSSSSSCQRIEEAVNMRNIVEQFTGDDDTNPPMPIFQQDESPVQAIQHNKLEENHFADLIGSSLDSINKVTSSKDILEYVKEIVQAFSLKWEDELTMKSDRSTLLHDCVMQNFKEVNQNCCFTPHLSSKDPNVEAYVVREVLVKEIAELVNLHFFTHPSPSTLQQLVEKDLAKRWPWLNIQVDTQDIAVEVEKHVLEKLVLEITSEMILEIHCSQPWGIATLWQD